jgi:hypothetical protein
MILVRLERFLTDNVKYRLWNGIYGLFFREVSDPR